MKELEKLIPKKCAGVSPMLVKDLVQQMIDEDGLINVEKCGNINVYWCFKNQITQKVYDSLERLKQQKEAKENETLQLLAQLKATRESERCEQFEAADGQPKERATELQHNQQLEEEIKRLQSEYSKLSQGRWDKQKIAAKKEALARDLQKLDTMADNIDLVVDFFRAKYGIDPKAIRQELEIPEEFSAINL